MYHTAEGKRVSMCGHCLATIPLPPLEGIAFLAQMTGASPDAPQTCAPDAFTVSIACPGCGFPDNTIYPFGGDPRAN